MRAIPTFAQSEALRDRLWAAAHQRPSSELYAVVDGARSPRVTQLLREFEREHGCLYDGPLPNKLAQVVPYLVRLELEKPFEIDLLGCGWGDAWAIFLESEAPFAELRRHLRRFLRVTDRRGRRMLFRFYDPRVLRCYLPSCTDDETRAFFGPIRRFFVEGVEGASLLTYELKASGLCLEEAPLRLGERW